MTVGKSLRHQEVTFVAQRIDNKHSRRDAREDETLKAGAMRWWVVVVVARHTYGENKTSEGSAEVSRLSAEAHRQPTSAGPCANNRFRSLFVSFDFTSVYHPSAAINQTTWRFFFAWFVEYRLFLRRLFPFLITANGARFLQMGTGSISSLRVYRDVCSLKIDAARSGMHMWKTRPFTCRCYAI